MSLEDQPGKGTQAFFSLRSQEVKQNGEVVGYVREMVKKGTSTPVFITSPREIAYDSKTLRALADLVDKYEKDPKILEAVTATKADVDRIMEKIKKEGENPPLPEANDAPSG